MEKKIDKSKISLYNNKDMKNKNKIRTLKQPDLNLIKNNNLNNDNISLSVNAISNKHKKEQHLLKSKKINFKSLNIVNKKENNQIMDDYLVKIIIKK